MADYLMLKDAFDRFLANEDRINDFANGDDTATWSTSDDVDVPSIRKFLLDKSNEIDTWLAPDFAYIGDAVNQTQADASATAADRVQTGQDASATAADRLQTGQDASATAADRVRTGEDAMATAADRVQTGLDRAAVETARDQTLAAFDNFDDRYLGSFAVEPVTDNDGDPLVGGTLYFDSVAETMKLYTGSAWVAAYVSSSGTLVAVNNLSDVPNKPVARTNLGLGSASVKNLTDNDDLNVDPANIPTRGNVKNYLDSMGAGIEFISSQDLNNDPTANFTGFDSSKYDSYIYTLGNVVPATDDVNLCLRTSSDGGVTFDDGASDYRETTIGTNGSVLEDTVLIAAAVGSASGEDGVSGEVKILTPHLAKRTMGIWSNAYLRANGFFESKGGGFLRDEAGAVNAVQFYFDSGNIESGTITMYGVRNSA